MSFENLTKLIEEHKKETHPYKRYEFDGTSYTLLLISINNLIKENQELKEKLDKYENPEDMTLMMMWCTEQVKDENEKLKRQLEDTITSYTEEHNLRHNSDLKLDVLETQQKEFIKYLEDEIQKKREKATTLTSFTRNVVPLKHCLQKYKSIIGE